MGEAGYEKKSWKCILSCIYYYVRIVNAVPSAVMISASFKDTLEIFQGTHFCLRPLKRIITHKAGKGCQALPSEDFYEFFSYCYCSHDWESVFLSAGGKCVCQNQVSAEGILVCTYDGNADASHACKADSTVYYVQ